MKAKRDARRILYAARRDDCGTSMAVMSRVSEFYKSLENMSTCGRRRRRR